MSNQTETNERTRVGERVSILPRGKKRIWVAEFHHAGVHRRQSLKTHNKKEAIRRAIAIEHKLNVGEYRSMPPSITIADARDRYLRALETDGRARKTIVRYRGELSSLANFAAPRDTLRLANITPVLFDDYRENRRKTHGTATVYHESVVIKQFLNWCVLRGLLGHNPLASYKIRKPLQNRRMVPTLAQVADILAHCSPALRVRVNVLFKTAMRVGECQALQKSDGDLSQGFITISRQISGPTKTKNSRRVPIHRSLVPLLQGLLAADRHELLITAMPSAKYPEGGHHLRAPNKTT